MNSPILQKTQSSVLAKLVSPSPQSFFSLLLSVCLYAYSLALIVYGALRLLTGESLGIVRVLDSFIEVIMLPALVLLPLSLLLRRWRVALLLLPTGIACLLIFGSLFIPRAAAQGKPDLTILTYNIHGGNPAFKAIAQTILDADADVVVLQEIWPNVSNSLTRDLAQVYPYSLTHPHIDANLTSRLGLAVFSRFPLIGDGYDIYQSDSSKLSFQINLNGTVVTIYDVHLANPLLAVNFDPKAHGEGITGLLDLLKGETMPLIVAGDFNMTDISIDYGRVTATLVDSFRESGTGFGFSFPTWSPVGARIDYVFHSSDVRSLKTETLSSSGNSDHYPVRAQLMINPVAVTPSP